MENGQEDEVSGPVKCDGSPESNRRAPTRHHPLFGALKGYMRVMPGTDLTKPADPPWGGDENM
jgi:hypothetical protein